MRLYNYISMIAVTALAVSGCSIDRRVDPAIPKDANIEAKVEKVLKNMSIDEKIGQMVQLNVSTILTDGQLDESKLNDLVGKWKIGSFLNAMRDIASVPADYKSVITKIQEVSMREIGIPCIYGLDEIHGSTYVLGGVLFPQELNLAATFDTRHATNMGRVIAYETRAAMVPWVFSPVMDLARDPRWPRFWESWGEDPLLQAEMSEAETRALQGDDPNNIGKEHVAVSLKHFIGYGVPKSGKDRTPAYIPDNVLREKFFLPFERCLKAGALNIMVNSASINGVPVHANCDLLTGWVKEGMKWDGMIVTDWADINNLYSREHVAADKKEAVALGINAGIDMIMDPYDTDVCVALKECIEDGTVSMKRMDDAVRRILRMKFRLGLFDEPVWDISGYDKFGGHEFRKMALEAALESEVLLKNEDKVLPISEDKQILVTGPNANSMRCLNGGWSYNWQGTRADEFAGEHNTILEALTSRFGEKNVRYEAGVVYSEKDWKSDVAVGIDRAVAAARKSDVIIVCIGENSYCETPGNIDDLTLSGNQIELVKELHKTGKPIVLILNEGRPRIINEIEPLTKAVVNIMLPGNYGADALSMLLAGDANFSGKLPFTYSKYVNSLHTYDYKVSEHVETMDGLYNYDAVMDVQWPFGYGLSYTQFEYSDLKRVDRESSNFSAGDTLRFEVTVKNMGDMSGKEAVLLYSSDLIASEVPDVKRLRAFDKVELQPDEAKVVSLSVPADDLAFVANDGRFLLEKGGFRISCGGQSLLLNCVETSVISR